MNTGDIEVENVWKTFRIFQDRNTTLKQALIRRNRDQFEEFWALKDVSFSVPHGSTFGIVGSNGAGKSTMLKVLARILVPDKGSVRANGRVSALLELGAGFHPELSGRENVFLNAALLGMTRREIAARYDEIVEFSGLEDEFLDTPVKTYSSGMYVRLAFSIAINVEPELLIIDEILAVGDIDFQRKCTERFLEFRNAGRTTVLVTHDMNSVRTMCDRAVWLDHGRLRGTGEPGEIVDGYTESMTGSTDRVATLGSYREGSGELQFTSARMLVDGEPRRSLRTGDDLVLELELTATSPIDDPAVSITVMTASGLMLSEPSTRDADIALGRIDDRRALTVRLRDLPLLPGEYQVHCTVSDARRHHVFDRVHAAVTFDVMAGTPLEQFGTVSLRPQWTVE
jgi:ABC-2 type transport system ATP-binding protein